MRQRCARWVAMLCAVALWLLVPSASFAEPTPGSSCPTNGIYTQFGGPAGGGSGGTMLCVGSVWKVVQSYGASATSVGIGTAAPLAGFEVSATASASAILLPRDTTENRPNGVNGMIRYNTSRTTVEIYANNQWQDIIMTNSTTPTPPGMGGTGYFVITSATTQGDLGGLAGANTFCRNDLSTYDWMGKPGSLDTNKVFAFLCDASTCQNLQASVTYYYARSGDPSVGGSWFFTDSAGAGPNDSFQWNTSDRLGAATGNYWTNRGIHGDSGKNQILWGPGPHVLSCSNWTISTTVSSGIQGLGSATDLNRWRISSPAPLCNAKLPLICFVNP